MEVVFSAPRSAVSVYCRYLQRVVAHPSLLQDPDVREFLEREEVSVMYLLDLFWRHTASSALLAVYDCTKLFDPLFRFSDMF